MQKNLPGLMSRQVPSDKGSLVHLITLHSVLRIVTDRIQDCTQHTKKKAQRSKSSFS